MPLTLIKWLLEKEEIELVKLNIKHKKQNNNYFVIPFILIIGFLFNYKTLKE